MKTIIIYMSNHGCTETVSSELAKQLNGDIELCNLKQNKTPDFSNYDRVIIGGSIHAGQIQRRLREFCEVNTEQLGKKELGLFICCMYEGQEAFDQLNNAFPEKLHQYSKAEAIFGGEFNFEKMKFYERIIVRKVAQVDQTVNNIKHDEIVKFAKKMDKTFSSFLMLI